LPLSKILKFFKTVLPVNFGLPKPIPLIGSRSHLLPRVAVILKAQYHRVFGCFKCTLCDGLQHVLGKYLGHERIAVDNDWLLGASVPEVELNASAIKWLRQKNTS